MELPILPESRETAPEVLIRAERKSDIDAISTHCEVVSLDGATAFSAKDRPHIWDANAAYDVRLVEGMSAEAVFQQIADHYRSVGTNLYRAIPSEPTMPAELVEVFEAHGYERAPVLHMIVRQMTPFDPGRDDLQILPARAVRLEYRTFRREVFVDSYGEVGADEMADCHIDQLDEPRLDLLCARLNRRVVAAAGVMSVGEIGVIWDVATHPEFRRQGIGRALLHHILDLCLRAQFKHVILCTDPENTPAIRLYESLGMAEFATSDYYSKTNW